MILHVIAERMVSDENSIVSIYSIIYVSILCMLIDSTKKRIDTILFIYSNLLTDHLIVRVTICVCVCVLLFCLSPKGVTLYKFLTRNVLCIHSFQFKLCQILTYLLIHNRNGLDFYLMHHKEIYNFFIRCYAFKLYHILCK